MTATATTTLVPSWAVTDAQLAAWGFPVEVVDKVCGSRTVMRAGVSRRVALHEAWKAGLVRIDTHPAQKLGFDTWAKNHAAWKASL